MHLSNKEFAEVTPVRKVPAIQDGDFKLFEWYLCSFLLYNVLVIPVLLVIVSYLYPFLSFI